VCCCFFQSLWTCHQEFRSYGGMKRVVGYMKNQLFEKKSKKMFQQCTRLNFDTFHAYNKVIGPSLE
jgi:hypothetical protein